MAGRIRQRSDGDLEENDEINVVPFIDVMLVLLIIFMVAAPLATVDVQVDLPTAQAEPRERPDKPLFVTLQEDLTFSVGEDPVTRDSLVAAIDAFTEGDNRTRVFLRIDRTVDYEHVMALMNLLRGAGYLTIALVGLEEAGGAAAQPSPEAGLPDRDAAVDGSAPPALSDSTGQPGNAPDQARDDPGQ